MMYGLGLFVGMALLAGPKVGVPAEGELFALVDLATGESRMVELPGGQKVEVKLVEVKEFRDSLRHAVRGAAVEVEVDGEAVTLGTGNYGLPVTVGQVQIDCPVTRGYYTNARLDYWGLEEGKDARLRIWPAGSAWMPKGRYVYPVRQRWFASSTQMANEPTHVDGGEERGPQNIYYHFGLDIGSCEGLVDVVATTDGEVVGARNVILPEYQYVKPLHGFGEDELLIRDDWGWFHRYAHFQRIEPDVQLGGRVHKGQKIGVIGKEGGTTWSHLHYDIRRQLPSGRWVTEEAYAFLWEAYQNEFSPALVAVGRPHQVIFAGDKAALDGTKSRGKAPIARYEWVLADGTTAQGPRVRHVYSKPGFYSEVLKVTDAEGRVAYDFPAVMVFGRDPSRAAPPTIHPAYAPSFSIRPGDPVTFKVRTFGLVRDKGSKLPPAGEETWDFGDGTPPVAVHSDGNAEPHAPDGYAVTVHRFAKAGRYLVRVERRDEFGVPAVGRLEVVVEGEAVR